MASQDKAFEILLELGMPAERPTRAELLDHALRAALALMDADAVAILTSSDQRGERLVLHAGSAMTAAIPVPPNGSEVLRNLAGGSQPLVVSDLSEDARFAATDGCPGVEAGPVIFTPLRQRKLHPAYIAAYRGRGRARYTMADIRQMLLLGAWFGAALESLRLSTSTEKIVVTDDLTDVYNYRFLKTALRRELRRASRFGQELSLVMVGVDQFKEFREANGDLRAAVLLKEVAAIVARQMRSFDVLAKRGEDGFVVIVPQTHREGAAELAERMREAVERHAFSLATAGKTTVSFGVASFPQDGSDIKDLVAATEHALQRAKREGSNRVATPASQAA
jgi:diguanylate cyclase (GGDEF)-like protein